MSLNHLANTNRALAKRCQALVDDGQAPKGADRNLRRAILMAMAEQEQDPILQEAVRAEQALRATHAQEQAGRKQAMDEANRISRQRNDALMEARRTAPLHKRLEELRDHWRQAEIRMQEKGVEWGAAGSAFSKFCEGRSRSFMSALWDACGPELKDNNYAKHHMRKFILDVQDDTEQTQRHWHHMDKAGMQEGLRVLGALVEQDELANERAAKRHFQELELKEADWASRQEEHSDKDILHALTMCSVASHTAFDAMHIHDYHQRQYETELTKLSRATLNAQMQTWTQPAFTELLETVQAHEARLGHRIDEQPAPRKAFWRLGRA